MQLIMFCKQLVLAGIEKEKIIAAIKRAAPRKDLEHITEELERWRPELPEIKASITEVQKRPLMNGNPGQAEASKAQMGTPVARASWTSAMCVTKHHEECTGGEPTFPCDCACHL